MTLFFTIAMIFVAVHLPGSSQDKEYRNALFNSYFCRVQKANDLVRAKLCVSSLTV